MGIRIITLIENNLGYNSKLYNEHGLSLYIEVDGINLLFDTGKSGDFIYNAKQLQVDLEKIDYVLLSHGHYDHSGGFKKLVENIKPPYKLIVGNGFFNDKYKLMEEETYKYNGNPIDEEFIRENHIEIKYVKEDIFYISENIMVFSNFIRSNNFETLNKKFHRKENENYVVDNFSDEIVLGVKSEKGLVVIVGCSHVGIVNILETIIERANMPIYAIIGGTHLIEADDERLKSTINFFKEKDINLLGLSHCTGEEAMEKIKVEFGQRFIDNNTGNIIEIG